MNRGTYAVVLKIDRDVEISRPSVQILPEGLYAYVGSAMNSLTGRLRRHLSKGKKIHWHIDQLTEVGEVVFIVGFVGKRVERELSVFLSNSFEVVKGFGSSDIGTSGNLFRIADLSSFLKALEHFCEKYGDFCI